MAHRFTVSNAGPTWYVSASNGAEVERFQGEGAEAGARALAAKLNGLPAPAPKPAPVVEDAPKGGAWGGEDAPKPGHVYSLSGLAGPKGVAEDVTPEVDAARRAGELAGTCADGGQVVVYRTFDRGERRCVVARWDRELNKGRPGFDGRALGDSGLPDGFEVWGYASQVVRFEGVAPLPAAIEAAAVPTVADPEPAADVGTISPPDSFDKPDRVQSHPVLPASWHPERGGYVRLLEQDRAGVSFRRMPPRSVRDSLKRAGYRWCPDDVEWVGPLAHLPQDLRPGSAGSV